MEKEKLEKKINSLGIIIFFLKISSDLIYTFFQFQSSTDNLWKKLFMTHVLYYSVNFEVLRNGYTVEKDKLEKK